MSAPIKKQSLMPVSAARTGAAQMTASHASVDNDYGMWRAEIAQLRQQKFSSFEDALEALSTAVLRKMPSTPTSEESEKKFLRDVILSDPGLVQLVKSVLQL